MDGMPGCQKPMITPTRGAISEPCKGLPALPTGKPPWFGGWRQAAWLPAYPPTRPSAHPRPARLPACGCLSACTVCRYMADLVIQYLLAVLEDVRLHPLEAADEEEAAEQLPTPMFQVGWVGLGGMARHALGWSGLVWAGLGWQRQRLNWLPPAACSALPHTQVAF